MVGWIVHLYVDAFSCCSSRSSFISFVYIELELVLCKIFVTMIKISMGRWG